MHATVHVCRVSAQCVSTVMHAHAHAVCSAHAQLTRAHAQRTLGQHTAEQCRWPAPFSKRPPSSRMTTKIFSRRYKSRTRVCPFSPFASPRTFLVLGTLVRGARACASVAQALLHAAAVCPVVSSHRDALALSKLRHHGPRRARARMRSRAAVWFGRRMAWTKSCLSSTFFRSFSQSTRMTRTVMVATQVSSGCATVCC